jgi:hypothetical protein
VELRVRLVRAVVVVTQTSETDGSDLVVVAATSAVAAAVQVAAAVVAVAAPVGRTHL